MSRRIVYEWGSLKDFTLTIILGNEYQPNRILLHHEDDELLCLETRAEPLENGMLAIKLVEVSEI